MTVLTLARMTDPPKSDRYTLIGLKQLIQKDVEVFAVAAEGWLPGAPEHAKENREYVEREVPVLVSEISKFCKSAEIQRIRSLRDEALAHRLRGKTLRPTYSDVGNAFEHAHRIVSKASSILTGRIWTPSDFFDVQELYAKDFWDAFQKGLVVQKEGRGAAS